MPSPRTRLGATGAVKGFVTEFNNVLVMIIDKATKADGSKTNNTSARAAMRSLRQLRSDLRSIVSGIGLNINGTYTTLSEIGLSFGPVGSAVGSTNTLQLDEGNFQWAPAKDPAIV